MNSVKAIKNKKGKVIAPKRNSSSKKQEGGQVRLFRWFKKSFSGKSRTESMDLLDRWILKKKVMTLFF